MNEEPSSSFMSLKLQGCKSPGDSSLGNISSSEFWRVPEPSGWIVSPAGQEGRSLGWTFQPEIGMGDSEPRDPKQSRIWKLVLVSGCFEHFGWFFRFSEPHSHERGWRVCPQPITGAPWSRLSSGKLDLRRANLSRHFQMRQTKENKTPKPLSHYMKAIALQSWHFQPCLLW